MGNQSCYCYSIKDSSGQSNQGAIDLKEFVTSRHASVYEPQPTSQNFRSGDQGGGPLDNSQQYQSNFSNPNNYSQMTNQQYVLGLQAQQKNMFNNQMIIDEERDEREDDDADNESWEGVINKRSQLDERRMSSSPGQGGSIYRRRQRAKPFNLKLVVNEETWKQESTKNLNSYHQVRNKQFFYKYQQRPVTIIKQLFFQCKINVQEEHNLLRKKKSIMVTVSKQLQQQTNQSNYNSGRQKKSSFHSSMVPQATISACSSTQNLNKMIPTMQKIQKDLRSETIGQIRELFNNHYLLQALPKEFQDLLITHLNFYSAETNQVIYRQDESISDELYVLLDGSISVYRNSNINNQPRLIEVIEAPCIIGEAALLVQAFRTHTIVAKEKCKLCGIHRNQFKDLVKFVSPQHCSTAKEIIENFKLFPLLEKKQQAMLIQEIQIAKFKKGTIIAKEGEESSNIYIINKGLVVSQITIIQKQNDAEEQLGITGTIMTGDYDEEELVLKSYSYGQIMGFEGYLTQDHFRNTSLTTIEDCEVFVVSKDLLSKIMIGIDLSIINSQDVDEFMREELRSQIIYQMFDNDEILKNLSYHHRVKIIQAMNYREFSQGEAVFFKYKDKSQKIVFCLKGRLICQNSEKEVFLQEAQIFGSQELYEDNDKKSHNHLQFECNVIADPFCIIAEVSKEAFEQSLGEDFTQIIQKNLIIQQLQKIPLFTFLPFTKLEWISEAFSRQEFKDNEYIYQQEQVGTCLYLIMQGKVHFYKNQDLIQTLEKGDYFNEKCLFFIEYHQHTAIASDSLVMYKLDKNDLMSLIEPSLKRYLTRKLKLSIRANRLEDLQMIEKLAQGTLKQVYEVEDRYTNQRYALKVVSKQRVLTYGLQNYIRNERMILQMVDHPFILKFQKSYKDQKRVYLLTEMIKGMDFFNELTLLQVLNKRESQFNIASVLLVIEYLHTKNIIHRDIKPENIFIDDEGFIKLLDVGTCKLIQDRTYTLVGTPAYTAPEVFLSIGYDYAADYWSLGVMLYEFLCGQLPFGKDGHTDPLQIYKDIIALYQPQISESKQQLKDLKFPEFLIDEQAKDLIKRLLVFSPELRFTNPKKIKEHQWFENFDFDALLCRLITPPFIPKQDQYLSANMINGTTMSSAHINRMGSIKKIRKREESVDSQTKMNILEYLENNDFASENSTPYVQTSFVHEDNNLNHNQLSPILIQQQSQPGKQSFTFNIQHQELYNWDQNF